MYLEGNMIPKIVALYLPQFHEVKENSEWYGNGYTDWTAVRNAKPLYKGHMQPKRPLNNNYYDLTNIEVLRWQTALAEKYGIDGFCFYHYWFDSNTRLLEKPAQILLNHKEININFCFSWVNESWKRTWSNIEKGNIWCDAFDPIENLDGVKDRGLLVKQRFGREEEWKKHIEYLIPFFLDERYMRIDGKPVLCIYQPCDILCIRSMIEVWNGILKENGISGIYLIGASYGREYSKYTDINYNHQPGTAFNKCRINGKSMIYEDGIEVFDYDTMWRNILNDVKHGRISCAFTGFDASPRKGRKGIIVQGGSPEKFQKYLNILVQRNMQEDNKLIFINAWNEWGEGMYLEPDEENKYKYLEAVKFAIKSNKENKRINITEDYVYDKKREITSNFNKAAMQVSILNRWLSLCRRGVRIEEFFNKYHYKKIAIYGMGILGRQLNEELLDSKIQVSYFLDKFKTSDEGLLKRFSLDDKLPDVDCIIVTALLEFDSIYDLIKKKNNVPIINIGEIFDDLY